MLLTELISINLKYLHKSNTPPNELKLLYDYDCTSPTDLRDGTVHLKYCTHYIILYDWDFIFKYGGEFTK